jgi:arginine utilization protein RocB
VAIITFFGSVFSARIEMTGRTENERALLDSVEAAIEKVRPEAKRQIKTRMFYPYISDSSFMAVCDDTLAVQALRDNMPQYGVKYTHDVEKIMEINVPVVNIGTFGRDRHMLTERVDMQQTFQNVPNITYETIIGMIG